MNGKKVTIEDKFLVPAEFGFDEMSGPGDSSAPASQVCNCTCQQAFSD